MSSRCLFFSDCGGCSYLDLDESKYREIKSQKLIENINKFVNLKPEFIFFDDNSRRKITLQIDSNNNIGFYKKNSRNLVKIDQCYVCEDKISDIFPILEELLSKFETNLIQKIQITNFDNILDLIFFVKRDLNNSQIKNLSALAQTLKINISYKIKNDFMPILVHENGKIFLNDYLTSSLREKENTAETNSLLFDSFENEIIVELNSNIFIQASKNALREIIKAIRDNIAINSLTNSKIVDIYSGFGIYSFAISDLAKKIVDFEGLEEMTELNHKNIEKNSLKQKISAQSRDLFNFPISWSELNDFDLALINPPRNGAGPQIKEIATSKLKNLIYVSCNYQSFLRDMAILLEKGFKIDNIRAIDQFYSTDHFELVAYFKRS